MISKLFTKKPCKRLDGLEKKLEELVEAQEIMRKTIDIHTAVIDNKLIKIKNKIADIEKGV